MAYFRSLLSFAAPAGACAVLASIPGSAFNAADDRFADAELKFVQIVFRHGARSPLTNKYWEGVSWQKGPDCGEKFKAVQLALQDGKGNAAPFNSWDEKQVTTILPGGCAKGELTLAGQQQAFNFGSWLKQRYINEFRLLPSSYQDGVLVSRTTNYARTKATLQGVLTGIYKTDARIPVTTANEEDEILIGSYQCAHLSGLLKLQAQRLKGEAKEDKRLQQLDQDCRKALNLPETDSVAYTDLYDALTSRQFHGKGWPEGMTEELYRRIEDEALRRMAAIVSPREDDHHGADILKLSSGQLFLEMQRQMEQAMNESQRSRMALYSGHDTTIMPVLASLIGDRMDRWPPYLSNVIIELWKRKSASGNDEDAYFVNALYNCEPIELNTQNPGVPLTLRQFREQYWDQHFIQREPYLEFCNKEIPKTASSAPSIGGDAVQGL